MDAPKAIFSAPMLMAALGKTGWYHSVRTIQTELRAQEFSFAPGHSRRLGLCSRSRCLRHLIATRFDQDLSAALLEFGDNLNIPVNVSAEVKGQISGRIQICHRASSSNV
ncbi:hypothetical protein ACQPTN_06820 [Bradyrhizobium sp. 13971]